MTDTTATFAPGPTIDFQGRPCCSANATGRIAGDWGMEAVPCVATRGLRSFVDRQGIVRRYCPALGHRENVERRFGRYVSEIADDPHDVDTLQPCTRAGHVEFCAGSAGGEHRLSGGGPTDVAEA